MLNRIRKAGTHLLILLLLAVAFWQCDTNVEAATYSTQDGLTLTANGTTGRVGSGGLTIGGISITSCSGLDGGFYLRDNTPGVDGLPEDVFNELICGEFTPTDPLLACEDCLGIVAGLTPWVFNRPQGSGSLSGCTEYQGSDVAKIEIDEGFGKWGLIYQDVALSSEEPDEIELYYLFFEMASECGWRSQTDPWGWDKYTHGAHRVVAYVEWFDHSPQTTTVNNEIDTTAIAVTKLEAFNTSAELTPFILRTYRPVLDPPVSYARIKFVVEGYMPNDGKDGSPDNKNYIYFDNVAFFEAPDIKQVTGAWDSGAVVLYDTQVPPVSVDLSMDLTVTDYDNYILFEGELINTKTDARAIDFGFSLPIIDYAHQQVEWCDDVRDATRIRADELEQTIPYRVVGPADLRLMTTAYLKNPPGSEKTFTEKTFREKGLDVSAYPFSSLAITKGTNPKGGLSFGDNLDASHAPISHFGYRVENPGPADQDFKGRYYVEFSLGLLGSSTSPRNRVPFSFILFRSDIPGWSETSTFREAAEKYQTLIFPDHFTLPGTCDDSWQFGGGKFLGAWGAGGYNDSPNDFGYRFTTIPNHDKQSEDLSYRALIENWDNDPPDGNDVDVLVYRHPWVGGFRNMPTVDEEMNVHQVQATIAGAFDPEDPLDGWGYGPVWGELYDAELANRLFLPGSTPEELFTRKISLDVDNSDPENPILLDSIYFYPVLLAEPPLSVGVDLIKREIDHLDDTYDDIGTQTDTHKGLAGILLDNVFNGAHRGLHVDVLDESSTASMDRLKAFVDQGGTLTYGLSHFKPAISQLPLDVNYMDAIRDRLDEIDVDQTMNFGGGSKYTAYNRQDELLGGNFNSTYFGGSKYGIIRADFGGFESSPVLSYNNGSAAFNFRRTVARDKNMARLISTFPCILKMRDFDLFDDCSDWKDYWDETPETMFKQIVNEAVWMALAWGFHPSIHSLLPDYNDSYGNLEDLIDGYIRPRFLGDTNFEGYTMIYKRLHLAGWKPVTNAEAHVNEGQGELPLLYVERFGPDTVSGENDAKFFTVLNNDTLSFTLVQLTEEDIFGVPPPAIYFNDIEDLQRLNDTGKCEDVQDCENYPDRLVAEYHFDQKNKHFYLEIHDPTKLGLWNGNLYAEQLVDNPANSAICNWPEIIADEFDESQGQTNYSIRRNTASPVSVIIGGPNPTLQQRILIEDKALMVFKIWPSLIVNNGPEGGDGGEREGSQSESVLLSQYYERYGSNWQRVESDLGYGGNMDQLPASDSGASAFYKFTIGLGGRYRVMAHVPATTEAPAPARYEAYVLEYLEDPAGETALGEPDWTTTLDLTGSESYNSSVDDEGFIEIGTVALTLTEPELATVVIRLSSAGDDAERTSAGSGYVLADAVKLVPEETAD